MTQFDNDTQSPGNKVHPLTGTQILSNITNKPHVSCKNTIHSFIFVRRYHISNDGGFEFLLVCFLGLARDLD